MLLVQEYVAHHLLSILRLISDVFCLLAHLQKLMSDKKCSAEKKAEMENVITQVCLLRVNYFFSGKAIAKASNANVFVCVVSFSDGQLHSARVNRPVCEVQCQVPHHGK